MARLKRKGESGAAKTYVTRSSAVRKLQISLADFRRLCILKGIFPREPKNKKKANKGSSAPTTFYYAKDIAYLAHEPVLAKLRDHKAFAKKLSRALGRGEWSSAKSLEDNKPVYRLDHIIKERYPTFIDAVRDIDDALCLVSLFAYLPSDNRLPPSLIENCARLTAEWQLYVMHTHALRKIFLSIKGIYMQAEVMDQTITWLVPYQFTQNIPSDVDVRVMLTFLELYQTLLGFVFFKLYTDAALVYPPALDSEKEAGGAGVNAFNLRSADKRPLAEEKNTEGIVKRIAGKDVRQSIRDITMSEAPENNELTPLAEEGNVEETVEEDFVIQPSKSNPEEAASLTTLQTLSTLPSSTAPTLFSPYTFFLSRETSRPLFEFIIRAFGGRVGWPTTSGSGSPFDENDDSITHVIIDRPLPPNLSAEEKEKRRTRKYVQPQWVVDCANAARILSESPYLQGETLPPHLSPFGEGSGAYDPTVAPAASGELDAAEDSGSEVEGDADDADVEEANESKIDLAQRIGDEAALRAAELDAEARGLDYQDFEKKVKAAEKKAKSAAPTEDKDDSATEKEMNKMMMSRKQKKLYEKMKFSEKKRESEREQLEQRKHALLKEKRKNKRTV